MKKEETIDYHVKATWHAISRMYNQEAGRYGTTMSTGYVLLNIDPKTGTRATTIAPSLGMETTSLSRLLKNLEDKGQIERKADPDDGRAVRIFLTEAGKRSRTLAKQIVTSFNETIREKIPLEKLNAFFDVIQSVNEVVEEHKLFNNLNYEQEQVN